MHMFWSLLSIFTPIAVILLLLILAILIFELVMLINVIGNNYISGSTKLLWILGMLLIHPFIAIAYYFTDYKKTKK